MSAAAIAAAVSNSFLENGEGRMMCPIGKLKDLAHD
jgi:hypothetical protein